MIWLNSLSSLIQAIPNIIYDKHVSFKNLNPILSIDTKI